jgi:NitT/TauT family transport system substrate-binding protein
MALVGGAGILPPRRRAWAADPALETTTVRIGREPAICFAPQYVCEALLRSDGFTDVRYVDTSVGTQSEDIGRGKFDFKSSLSLSWITAIDAGVPIAILTGVHAGCYELFAHRGVRGIAELKGKSVGTLGGNDFFAAMAAYVGLDPKKDFTLVDDPDTKPLDLSPRASSTRIWRFHPKCKSCMRARPAM